MSRLRQIIDKGNGNELRSAIADVLHLCSLSLRQRKDLLAALRSRQASIQLKTYPDDTSNQIPGIFCKLAHEIAQGNNAHYQLAIVVWYMNFDPELFARNMLQGEAPQFQDQFMKALKEKTTYFVDGRHMNGALMKKTDDFVLRRTGPYVCWVCDCFALL